MNALLIYPEWPDTYWSFKHALPFEGKRSVYPPLGLMTVASLLPAHWTKRLVDTNIRPLTDADLKWADVAMLSGMLVHKQELLEILVCPESRQPVRLADAGELDRLNAAISSGSVTNRAGQSISELVQEGLVRQDGRYLYPVRDDIPIMLIDEAIPL